MTQVEMFFRFFLNTGRDSIRTAFEIFFLVDIEGGWIEFELSG